MEISTNTSLNKEITAIDKEVNELLQNYRYISSEYENYRDLTSLKTYTIDDNETIEIDDAISIETINNKSKVWVHIASPAALINYNSQ